MTLYKEGKNYTYIVFPFAAKDDFNMSIAKWPDSRVSNLKPSITDCPKAIQFPFAELPSFKSHIHPILAIYNFGIKIEAAGLIPSKRATALFTLLHELTPLPGTNTSRYAALEAAHPNLSNAVNVCYNFYEARMSGLHEPKRASDLVYDLASFFDTPRKTRSQLTKTGTPTHHIKLNSSGKLRAVLVDARSPSTSSRDSTTSSHDSTTDSRDSTADVDNGRKPVGPRKKSKHATEVKHST